MRPAQWTLEHTHVVRRHSVSNLADYQFALGISGQEAALEAARRGMVAKTCGIRLSNDLRLEVEFFQRQMGFVVGTFL